MLQRVLPCQLLSCLFTSCQCPVMLWRVPQLFVSKYLAPMSSSSRPNLSCCLEWLAQQSHRFEWEALRLSSSSVLSKQIPVPRCQAASSPVPRPRAAGSSVLLLTTLSLFHLLQTAYGSSGLPPLATLFLFPSLPTVSEAPLDTQYACFHFQLVSPIHLFVCSSLAFPSLSLLSSPCCISLSTYKYQTFT